MVNREGQLSKSCNSLHFDVTSGTVTGKFEETFILSISWRGQAAVASIILILKFNRPGAEKGAARAFRIPTISNRRSYFPASRDSQETDWDFDFGRGFGYKTTRIYREH